MIGVKKKTKNVIDYIREDNEKIHKLNSILTKKDENKLYIQLKFKQKFLKENNSNIFIENFVLNIKKNKLKILQIPSLPSKEYLFESQCPMNDSIIIRGIKNEKKRFFEIWENHSLKTTFEITNFFEHIYFEDNFGYIEWNKNGNKIVFCAEKKVKEEIKIENIFENFNKNIDGYLNQNDNLKGIPSPPDNRYNPVVFIFDLKINKLFEIDNCKNNEFFTLSPIFYKESLIFVGLEKENFQYSIDCCFNRPKKLYFLKKLNLIECKIVKEEKKTKDKKFVNDKEYLPIMITKDIWTAFDPFLSDDSDKLFFTGRKDKFYSHNTCFQFFEVDLKKFLCQKISITNLLIDIKNENSGKFNGIYKIYNDQGFLYKIKYYQNNLVVINTCQRGRNTIYLFDLQKKKLILHPIDNGKDSYSIIHKVDDYLFISRTRENILSEIIFLKGKDKNPFTLYKKDIFNFKKIDNNKFNINNNFENFINSYHKSETKLIDLKNGAQAILYLSEQSKKKKTPLIVIIHGGPNNYSPMVKKYTKFNTIFLNQGFNILSINYRGSLSYGLNQLNSLYKNCGKNDINDSLNLIKKSLNLYKKNIDENQIALHGYSHGGFIAAHLLTKIELKNKIKASLILNGVLYCPIVISGSIPKWSFATYNTDKKKLEWPISKNNLKIMYENSPILNVREIQSPCCIVIGELDSTIRASNSKYFYNCLKKYRDDCKIVVYPEEYHFITNSEISNHLMVITFEWFVKYLKL